jgi:hypothetical protein
MRSQVLQTYWRKFCCIPACVVLSGENMGVPCWNLQLCSCHVEGHLYKDTMTLRRGNTVLQVSFAPWAALQLHVCISSSHLAWTARSIQGVLLISVWVYKFVLETKLLGTPTSISISVFFIQRDTKFFEAIHKLVQSVASSCFLVEFYYSTPLYISTA